MQSLDMDVLSSKFHYLVNSKGVKTFALNWEYEFSESSDLGCERIQDIDGNLILDQTSSVYQKFYSHLQKYLTKTREEKKYTGNKYIYR